MQITQEENILIKQILDKLNISDDYQEIVKGTINYVVIFPNKVIRVSQDKYRSKQLVQAEIDFLKFVEGRSKTCVKALDSKVRSIKLGTVTYHITQFTKIDGKQLKDNQLDHKLVHQLGVETARLHSLSQQFTPGRNIRHHWTEEIWFKDRKNLLKDDAKLLKAQNALIDYISKIPDTPDSFGLIHGDLNRSNIFVNNDNSLTFIDFDDMHYGYYLYDLATTIENLRQIADANEKELRRNLIQGYELESGKKVDKALLDVFMHLRGALVYNFMRMYVTDWDSVNTDFRQTLDVYRTDIISNYIQT